MASSTPGIASVCFSVSMASAVVLDINGLPSNKMVEQDSPVQFKWAILRYSFSEEGWRQLFFRLADNADGWKHILLATNIDPVVARNRGLDHPPTEATPVVPPAEKISNTA